MFDRQNYLTNLLHCSW